MTKDDDILIRIGGKTYRLRDDVVSLRKIPWTQRKRLIEILETMKQAEYVPAKDQQPPQSNEISTMPAVAKLKTKQAKPEKPATQQQPPQDAEAMMQRFLAEQHGHRSSIPSKTSVYKWFLIIFSVILLLVLIF